MSRRALAFVVFALVVSAGCVRLGFWQLSRLGERRALNEMLTERLGGAPVSVRELPRDTATLAFRRVTASGTYDFANEFALASRTRQGSPGVNVITPLRVAGTDTAVLVNRGWVYAPDAMTVDLSRWREPDGAAISGFVTLIQRSGPGPVSPPSNPRVVRHLYHDSLTRRLPYPVETFLVVATDSSRAGAAATPARLLAPALDEGPHLGYAIQWFAFALIGVIGAVVGVRADRKGVWLSRPTTIASVRR